MSKSVKHFCTGCTAPIDVDARITRGFCQYCGTPYSINDSVYEKLFLQEQQERLRIEREERIEQKIKKLKAKRNRKLLFALISSTCCFAIATLWKNILGHETALFVSAGLLIISLGTGFILVEYGEEYNRVSGKIENMPNRRAEIGQAAHKKMKNKK